MNSQFLKTLADQSPITHENLILYGYTHHWTYYCAPHPAHGGTYRLKFESTSFLGSSEGLKPVKGTEEWKAFLTYGEKGETTIRHFKTMGELNYFHMGMCGGWLYE